MLGMGGIITKPPASCSLYPVACGTLWHPVAYQLSPGMVGVSPAVQMSSRSRLALPTYLRRRYLGIAKKKRNDR